MDIDVMETNDGWRAWNFNPHNSSRHVTAMMTAAVSCFQGKPRIWIVAAIERLKGQSHENSLFVGTTRPKKDLMNKSEAGWAEVNFEACELVFKIIIKAPTENSSTKGLSYLYLSVKVKIVFIIGQGYCCETIVCFFLPKN